MDEQTARRDLITVCHLMYERSYVVSSDGNVSVRLDDGRILATPTMTCKGRMREDLLAITDLDGRALNDRRASSELAMHLLIYRERPEINCGKAFRQHRQQGGAALSVEPTGKRHVKAVIVHHIRVSPALKVSALHRRQSGRIAARTISFGERRTERIEFADAIGRKLDQFRWRLGRDHRNKAAD